jgi:hypothetical protein
LREGDHFSFYTDEALAFGQEDDVTVLTLTRVAAGEESVTLLNAPVLVGS